MAAPAAPHVPTATPLVSETTALVAPPTDPALAMLLAEIYPRLHEELYDEVTPRLAKAKELAPNHPEVLEVEGDLAFARNQFGAALKCYKQAYALNPTDAGLEEKYALALVRLREPMLLNQLGPDLEDDSFWSHRIKRPPWASGVMSAALPGLGQWFNGDWFKGAVIVVVSVGGFISNIVPILQPLLHALRYNQVSFGYADIATKLFSGTNLLITLVLFGVWVYSVVDAVLVARNTTV